MEKLDLSEKWAQMSGMWTMEREASRASYSTSFQRGVTAPENLAALCEDCHTRIHPHMRGRAGGSMRIYQSLSNTERLVLGPFAPEYYGGIAKIMSKTGYPSSETASATAQRQQTWNPAYPNNTWSPNNSVWGMNPFNSFMWAKMFPGQLPLGGIFGQAMAGQLL